MKKKKVLTIREPYVTPIANGIKHFETRGWKTNYRGEIYIHTAKQTLGISKGEFPLGCIVLKANLTDCICMDEEFVKAISKDKDEYKWGFYEVERYAWKLEDVEILTEPIPAKGRLGIWDF